MTSDQRRNEMASRKLARERVLRIMQGQSGKHTDNPPAARAATTRAEARQPRDSEKSVN